jgi:hypothetical protein
VLQSYRELNANVAKQSKKGNAMLSNAEKDFKALYKNARHVADRETLGTKFTVYAGDYLCAESYSRQNAYNNALEWTQAGFIQPDRDEVATTNGHPL